MISYEVWLHRIEATPKMLGADGGHSGKGIHKFEKAGLAQGNLRRPRSVETIEPERIQKYVRSGWRTQRQRDIQI